MIKHALSIAILCLASERPASAMAAAFQIDNAGTQAAQDQPVTLGFVFAPGEIPAGKSVSATSQSGVAMQLQVDAKATHPDGSLRHAVLTLLASVPAGKSEVVTLSAAPATSAGPALSAAGLLATGWDATVRITLDGKTYAASARSVLQAAATAGTLKTWLSGPLATEWLVSAPLVADPSESHPHLHVRFAIRACAGYQRVRTDMTLENGWAFEPNPSGFTYDVVVESGSQIVYQKAGLQHTDHTRWRKVFWYGEAPVLDSRLDPDYLFSTGAVPRYDRDVKPSETALAGLASAFEPMSPGDLSTYMPETGAQDDIGPLPRFAALYLLSMDPRAKANVLANGEAGGSFQIHYRDKAKDLPVTLDDYPYMTILGNPGDTRNPATGKNEGFPEVANGLEKLTPDDAHQPSIAYLPYLISGDRFYLEELQSWALWNMIIANPAYRETGKGLLNWAQVRGQAWSMRTLGDAAYITPDDDPLKKGLLEKLQNNLTWYNQHSSGDDSVNQLGWLDVSHARAYDPNGIAPWQDDFFTYSIGHLADMGFAGARDLLKWKAKFVVGRLMDPGFCWLHATAYSLQVGPADKSSEYATFGALYQANFPAASACTGTSMDGYPEDATGYGGDMQPALAAAVNAGIPDAAEAWARYQTRNPKQDYSAAPQFAVVPGRPGGASLAPRASAPRKLPQVRLRWLPASENLAIQKGDGEDAQLFDLAGRRLIAIPGPGRALGGGATP